MASEQTRDPIHRTRYSFETDGENMICDTWIEPGGRLPPHLHPNQEERWTVVEGSARFQLGDRTWTISPADGAIIVQPGTVHALASVGDTEAHLRCEVIPALGIREFLEASAAAAREGLFTRGGIPKSLKGARWAGAFLKQHRDDVVMQSPPQFLQRVVVALFGRSTPG